jgi:type IV pilus assembly protein PilQ
MMKSNNRIRNSASLIILATLVMILAVGCASQKPAPQGQPGSSGAAAGSKQITEVIATEDAESYLVLVKGNRQLTYTSVKQNLPLGVLFYFPETGIDPGIMASIAANNDVIESVETSLVSEEQDMSRILVSLKKDTPYEVTPEGTGIRIAFVKPAGSPPPRGAAEPVAGTPPDATVAGDRLKGVYAIKSENQTRVSVSADGALADYKSFVLDNPPRIVFDIAGLKSPFKGQQVLKVNTPWVVNVRHQGYPDKVRVVLDTKKPYLKTFTAVPVENGLMILVADEKPAAAAPSQMRATQPPAAVAKPAGKDMPVAAAPMPPEIQPKEASGAALAADSEKTAWLNRLDFRSEEAGKSTIIVGTTRPVRYDLNEKSDKLLQLMLYDTQLPEYRRRPLITTRFESAANRITPLQTDAMKDNAIVAIELREAVPYQVEQKDDLLLIRLEASSIPPKPLEQADLPSWKKVLAQTEAGAGAQAAPGQPPAAAAAGVPPAGAGSQQKQAEPPLPLPPPVPPPAPAAEPQAVQAPLTPPPAAPLPETAMTAMSRPQYQSVVGSSVLPPPVYTGEKIALDFFETDIKNVFRILREISGKNFAIDKNVTGTVTLTLEKPVPWDQVLDLVLKMNRLGMTYEGDIVRIATLATLTAEEKARQAKIAAEQKSRQAVMDLEPLVTEYISVNYSDARSEILPHIKPVLTKDRGKVSVDQRNNQLIVTDTADKIARIKEIVERIDTVTPQVIIEAKVVEISSEFSREIGIEWGADWGGNNDGFSINGGNVDASIAMNYPSAGGSTVGFVFERAGNVALTLNATLNAVEANRQGRIISAPKIVTLDNKKAKIKQGLEVPYLERDSSGNATVRFKNVDLLLEVTPTVTPDDRILMKIFLTKNDALPSDPGEAPALSTNEAQTELLVNDGDTIVIGGIIKRNESDAVTGWPGLKDVPLLGWLFKSNAISDRSNELLIFLSPRIVMLEQRRLL